MSDVIWTWARGYGAMSPGRPNVSVIIPTLNRKAYLQEALVSLGDQTYPMTNLEVIVVDDGSIDGTEEIATRPFPFPLRYVRQSNQGSALARNVGVTAASGDLLIFL